MRIIEYINKEEILKFSIRIHHYDRERGNAHYIKGVESAMEYIENIPPTGCNKHSEDFDQSISGFGFSFWVNEDDFCGYGEK